MLFTSVHAHVSTPRRPTSHYWAPQHGRPFDVLPMVTEMCLLDISYVQFAGGKSPWLV